MSKRLSSEREGAFAREGNALGLDFASDAATEKYYRVADVAKILGLSSDKVRRMFQNEPGVLVFHAPPKKYKRGYTTLRIPESVLMRVMRRSTNV